MRRTDQNKCLTELSIGYVKTYIISPSTIYGIPKNGFTEAGLQHSHSIQIPMFIRASLGRGQGGMIGLGKNKWPNVHIDDGELMSVLIEYTYYTDISAPRMQWQTFISCSSIRYARTRRKPLTDVKDTISEQQPSTNFMMSQRPSRKPWSLLEGGRVQRRRRSLRKTLSSTLKG